MKKILVILLTVMLGAMIPFISVASVAKAEEIPQEPESGIEWLVENQDTGDTSIDWEKLIDWAKLEKGAKIDKTVVQGKLSSVLTKAGFSQTVVDLANSAVGELWDTAEQQGFWSIFSMEHFSALIIVAVLLIMAIIICIILIKYKKVKGSTLDTVKGAVTEIIEKVNSEAVQKALQSVFQPTVDMLNTKLTFTEDICKVLARCMLLAQENTAESRLAIVKELTNLKTDDIDLAEQVKNLVNTEIEKKEKERNEKQEAIRKLEEANNNIVVEDMPIEKKESESYGEI